MDAVGWKLDVIDVAAACPADWNEMQGDDRIRHCGECRRNVYNLSGMTRDQAEHLVQTHEDRLCVRFFRRADGTMLTTDCPVGLRALRRRAVRLIAGIAALITAVTLGAWSGNRVAAQPSDDEADEPEQGPLAQLIDWVEPPLQSFMGFAINLPCTSPTSDETIVTT